MLRALILSSLLEVSAISLLALFGESMMIGAFLLHLIASLCFAYGVGKRIRAHWTTWSFAFSMSFFMPLLAAFGLAYALYRGENKFEPDEAEEEVSPFKQITLGLEDDKRLTLDVDVNIQQGDVDMMETLLATNAMQDQEAIPLLQKQLHHEAEDVRLLAVSLLDQRENAIRDQINKLEVVIETEEEERAVRYRLQLARLYLSMAELGLAKDEMRTQVLREARDHVLAVVQKNPEKQAKAHYLLAQIYLELGDFAKSEPMYALALKQGIAKRLVIPRLAEIAYRTRRFNQLRFYLRQLDPQQKAQAQYAHMLKAWA